MIAAGGKIGQFDDSEMYEDSYMTTGSAGKSEIINENHRAAGKVTGLGVVEESVEISVNGVVTLARTNCGLFRLPSASDNSVLMLLLSLRILIPPASAKLIFTSRLQKSES